MSSKQPPILDHSFGQQDSDPNGSIPSEGQLSDNEASMDGDPNRPKAKRGRPRLQRSLQSQTERRRAQVRHAQRTYRLRKESAIQDLQDRVALLETILSGVESLFLNVYEVGMEIALRSENSTNSNSSPTEFNHDLMQLLAFSGIRFGNLLALAGLGQNHEERLLSSRKKASDLASKLDNLDTAGLKSDHLYPANSSTLSHQTSTEGLEALRTKTGFFNSTDVTTDEILNAINSNFCSDELKFKNVTGALNVQPKLQQKSTDTFSSPSSSTSPQEPSTSPNPPPNQPNKPVSQQTQRISPLVDPSSGFLSDFPPDMISQYVNRQSAVNSEKQQPQQQSQPNPQPQQQLPPFKPTSEPKTEATPNLQTPINVQPNTIATPAATAATELMNNNPQVFQSRSNSPTLTMDQLRQLDILSSKSLSDKNPQMDLSQNSLSREEILRFWNAVANRNGRSLSSILTSLDVSYTMPTRQPDFDDKKNPINTTVSAHETNSAINSNRNNADINPSINNSGNSVPSEAFPQTSLPSASPMTDFNEVFKNINKSRERQSSLSDFNVFRNISLQSVAPSGPSSHSDIEMLDSPPDKNIPHPREPEPAAKSHPSPSFDQILEELNTYNFSNVLNQPANSNNGTNNGVLAAVSAVNALTAPSTSDGSSNLQPKSRTPSLLDIFHQYQQKNQSQTQTDGQNLTFMTLNNNLPDLNSSATPPQISINSSFEPNFGNVINSMFTKRRAPSPVPHSLSPMTFYDFLPQESGTASDVTSTVTPPSKPSKDCKPPKGFDPLPASSSPPKALPGNDFSLPVYMTPSKTVPGMQTFISREELQAAARDYLNSSPLPSAQPELAIYSELSERIFRCALHWVLRYYAEGNFTVLERIYSNSFAKTEHFQITRVLSALQVGVSVNNSKWVGKIEDDALFPGYLGPAKIQERFLRAKMQLAQQGLDIDEDAFVQAVSRTTYCLGSIPRISSTLLESALTEATNVAQFKKSMTSAAATLDKNKSSATTPPIGTIPIPATFQTSVPVPAPSVIGSLSTSPNSTSTSFSSPSSASGQETNLNRGYYTPTSGSSDGGDGPPSM